MPVQQYKQAILGATGTLSKTDPLIVTFADQAYLEVLLNWLVSIDRLGIKNYLIFSLDREIFDYLSKRNIPTVLMQIDKGENLGNLWVTRAEIFRLLCSLSIDFIHSDADAIWLRDPVENFFTNQDCDLIASQGTIWPPFVLEQWHFVLCCGLFYMRSSPAIDKLLEELVVDIKSSNDDQVSMNKVLAERHIQWHTKPESAYKIRFQQHEFLCSKEIITGQSADKSLKISVLPHHQFQRLPMQGPEAYVKHLLTPKEQQRKMAMFAETDCLFLNPKWREIEYDSGCINRIAL